MCLTKKSITCNGPSKDCTFPASFFRSSPEAKEQPTNAMFLKYFWFVNGGIPEKSVWPAKKKQLTSPATDSRCSFNWTLLMRVVIWYDFTCHQNKYVQVHQSKLVDWLDHCTILFQMFFQIQTIRTKHKKRLVLSLEYTLFLPPTSPKKSFTI